MMLTLYHRTSPEAAAAILREGRLITRENNGQAYASTRPSGHATGYGSAIVELLVPEPSAQLEDEFPDGELHYRVPLDSTIVDVYTIDADGRCRAVA